MAPIRPLAWEPPHAVGAALEKAKRQQQQQKSDLQFCLRILMVHQQFGKFPLRYKICEKEKNIFWEH